MRLLLFILCLICLPLSVQAQESVHGICGFNGGNVLWTLKGDTLFVHGKGEMANYEWAGRYLPPWDQYANQIKCVVIEDSVTSVGEYAFQFCSQLTSVVLPQTLKAIGAGAFWKCTALDSITIPDSVSIGFYAFNECTSLYTIKLPEYLFALERAAFWNCVSLDSIRIPKGIRTIEGGTFNNCKSLRYVEIPNCVTAISDGAFKGCESLHSIDIPNSVTRFGGKAFCGCSALDSITIPNSVTSIGESAFDGCANLKSVMLSENLSIIPEYAFKNCSSLASIVIPEGVTTIERGAFAGCGHAATVVIPKNVRSIGPQAFYDCLELGDVFCYPPFMPETHPTAFDNNGHYTLLATLHVPKRLIGEYSITKPWSLFMRCVALPDEDVEEPDEENSSTIYYTFNEDGETVSVTSGSEKYVANVKVPARILADGKYYDVTTVENGAFMKSPDLYTVFLNNSIRYVGRFAFADCSGLVSVRLPNSINAIEDYTFSNCISLSGITIPSSVTSIGEGAFADCRSLKTISLPERTTSIGMRAFANCSALTTVGLSKQLTLIDDNAFENCRSLTSLTFPNTITLIGNTAFKDCTGLTEIVFDGCMGEIWENAFTGCTGLKDIYTYSDIPPAADEMAFEGSNYDANLHVPAASLETYKSTAPWCYFKHIIPHTESVYGGIICQYDYNTTDLTATLRKVIVSDNTHADKLVIPAELKADGKTYTVTAIAKYALKYIRPGFSSIEIPSTVRTIVTNTLDIAERLKTIRIMGDVERIERTAFAEILYSTQGPQNNTLNDFYCYSSFVPELSPLVFNAVPSGYSRNQSDDDIAEIEENGDTYYLPRYFTYTWRDADNNAHQATQYQYQIIEHATLHVPASLVESYQQTFPWNMFGNIVALTEEDYAEGIEEIIHNSQLTASNYRFIMHNDAIYNLQGQRIKTLQKGLNIVGRKKVLVKN